MLEEGDPDDSGTQVTYTLMDATDHGSVRLLGSILGVGDSFTQDDIDSDRLTYSHNGSETLADSFQFQLADGGENGSLPVSGTFHIGVFANQ